MTAPSSWLKPLLLEKKQGFLNRSVSGGLDRFVMKHCEELLQQGQQRSPAEEAFLKEASYAFSQYLTYGMDERRAWVEKLIGFLEKLNPERPAREVPVQAEEKISLMDPLLPFVPSDKVRAFHRTGLKTIEDGLKYIPKWVLHQGLFTPIAQCQGQEKGFFIKARINGISQTRRGPREVLKVNLQDATGNLLWIWFNRPYLKKELQNGRWVILHDTPQVSQWGKQVIGKAESYEFLEPQEEKALQDGKTLVFYPTTATLTQAFWRRFIQTLLDKYGPIFIQQKGMAAEGLPELSDAYRQVHHPKDPQQFEAARKRMAFEELLTLQTFLMLKRREIERRDKGRKYQFEGGRILKFRKTIPYQLTGAQKKVLGEIRVDLAKPYPMNRLLQGDVGSGKTLVAAIAFLYAADSGVQCALMAPTEILSRQHYQNLKGLLEPLELRVTLLTSDMKVKEKRETLKSIEEGRTHLVIGTHALLEKQVGFKNLGFLVIDERHKFGVLQRAALEEKGKWPDCLMMTATPFPRALVLTEYGDTDLSVLDEFPKGRKLIQTFWKGEAQKNEVYSFAKSRMVKGEQVFWVFPAVDESKSFLKSAVQMHQYFKNDVFHGFKVGLLHGQMKKEEKEEVMRAFAKGELQLLVATTVVEVGVDVPKATVMAVEHAERFGLAQLHQLRGRVGRDGSQAYCYLLTSPMVSADAVERMKIMVSTLDGFKLSEFDLKMRGPGEVFGLAQSGRREGGIVDLQKDVPLVEVARERAGSLLERDPALKSKEAQSLRENLSNRYHSFLNVASLS